MCVINVLEFSQSKRWAVLSHYCFTFKSLKYGVGHLYKAYFPVVYLFVNVSIQIFCQYFNWLVCFLTGKFKSTLNILDLSLISYVFWKYILAICGFSFYSLNSGIPKTKHFSFNEVQLINFFLLYILLLALYLKIHCQTKSHLDFLLHCLLEFL